MAERFLLADGSNQHSASVQLVSAREDHSSTAARALRTLLRTGGEEKEGERRWGPEGTEKAGSHKEGGKEDNQINTDREE